MYKIVKVGQNWPKWPKIQVGNIGQNINPIAQCENFKILLPLRFYVKLNLADFRRSKTAILQFLGKFTLQNIKKFPKHQYLELLKR